MYGMKNKAPVRIKAMNAMMKEKPSFAMKKPQMDQESQMEGEASKGLISMPVTPEEKQMILKMRKMGGMEGQMEGMEGEESEEFAPEME